MLSLKSIHRTRQPVLVFCSPERMRKEWYDDKIKAKLFKKRENDLNYIETTNE